jgi:hypothetical protein
VPSVTDERSSLGKSAVPSGKVTRDCETLAKEATTQKRKRPRRGDGASSGSYGGTMMGEGNPIRYLFIAPPVADRLLKIGNFRAF